MPNHVNCISASSTRYILISYDADNTLRMVASGFSFAGAVNAIFDPLRQSARGNEMVTLRLLEALAAVMTVAKTSDYRAALIRQAELIYQSAMEAIPSKADRETVIERFERCKQTCDTQQHQTRFN